MQRQVPQFTRSDNPMERQITYLTSPFESRPNLISEPYFPLTNQYQFIPDTEEDDFNELSPYEKEEINSITSETPSKHMALRASTAPARPLTDIEEFRRSSDFLLLEHTVICASHLIQRSDHKYDLDTEDGQRSCKKFLNQLERLSEVFKVNCVSRAYRSQFSHAYRVLYKDGSLCYLTEILDSAQEGFPYLWVNGERYVFSREVLEAGSRLFNCFCKIQHVLRDIYNRVCEETCPGTVDQVVKELRQALYEFDTYWVDFEYLYVMELMLIEDDARRYVTEAIKIEKEMVLMEIREKAKGRIVIDSNDYNDYRARLVNVLGKINSVANIDGRGRDDLTVDILIAAEGLSRRMSSGQNKAVLQLAESIRQTFTALRFLFRKYEQNIEAVDPQLKNNNDLVDALIKFEDVWEKGKKYFLNTRRSSQLIHFSQALEQLADKYSSFKEQIEFSDAEIFMIIPAFCILQCLENQDRGICQRFYPPMFDENERMGLIWKRLKRSYTLGKLAASSSSEYFELLEMAVIGANIPERLRTSIISRKFDNVDGTLHKLKTLAIELQRYKPTEWNLFLDIVLVNG